MKRLRALGVAALCLALAGGAWWWARGLHPTPAPAPAVAAATAPSTVLVAAEPATGREPADSIDPARPVASTVAAPRASSAAAEAGPAGTRLDLCGVGPLPIRPPAKGSGPQSFEILPGPMGHLARVEAWRRVLTAMELDPSEHSRAAALVLRASGLLELEATSNFANRALQDGLPHVLELARQAAGTRDAAVLQWALSLCERAPNAVECQALSVQQLVALAPDNGRNWLLLGKAYPQRQDEALQRAAAAPVIRSLPPLWPAVQAALPAGLPPYLMLDLAVQTIGIHAGLPDSASMNVFSACQRPRAAARAACMALADALHQRGQSLITVGIGVALGKRAGWPAEKVAAAEAESSDLMQASESLLAEQPYSCDSVQRVLVWMRDTAQFGEAPTLRRMVAASAASAAFTAVAAPAAKPR